MAGLEQLQVHQELSARVRELEERVKTLEQRCDGEAASTDKALGELRDALETEQVSREILEERKGRELRKIESAITLDINFERQSRKEDETRILKRLDERCLALSLELGAHTYGAQAPGGASSAGGAAPELDRIIQVVEDERQARRAFEEELLSKVDRETRQLRQLIDMEKTVREEATMNMISMIEKTRHRMQHDMEKARAERETAEDTILRILDHGANAPLESSKH